MYSSFQRRLDTLENVFDREMKSECIHHFREDWLWRMFSIGKWRVNVFKATSFREDFISEKIGSGERFRSGNEEWMYSNILRDLAWYLKTSFQIRFHFKEDCVLWRTFSFGKWRVNVFKHTKWLAKWLRVPRQKNSSRSGKSKAGWTVQRRSQVSEKTSFQIRTFSFGKWRVNVFKHTTWLDLLYKKGKISV